MNRFSKFALVAAVAGLGWSCSSGGDDSDDVGALASSYDSDIAVAWFDLLFQNVKTASLNPPVASRVIGYTGVTAYESIVRGTKHNRSLVGQLNDLDSMPKPSSGEHHWPTVLNRALAEIQRDFFASTPAALAAIDALEAANDTTLQASVASDVYDRSRTRGEVIADTIFTWSQGDGYSTYNNCSYTPPVGPGAWEPTPPAFVANPLQPCWGQLRPFVMLFGSECASLPAIPYSEVVGSKFYNEALEVRDTVDNLTPEQLAIAQFWADGGGTGTPPGHWIRIVSQVSTQQGLPLDVAVEAYARVGLAVADAFICCWDMKYFYNLLRPITYIQSPNGINDPTWTTAPGIPTPPFPEYTSGHSTQSGAASYVLTDLLGTVAFTDDTHAGVWPARSFGSFDEAADEAAISRLYGGIHYRAAIVRGVEQGRCIGATILDTVRFRD